MTSDSITPAVGAGAQATTSHAASTHPQKNTKISHGRGGAANIGEDDNVYADGGIVREGVAGDQGDGAYSTGRGGNANIGLPRVKATEAGDQEVIPETAIRDDRHEVFHTGRGGEGNLHHENSRTDSPARKVAHKEKHHKTEENGPTQTSTSSETPAETDKSSTTSPTKSKNRWSLFGKKNQANGSGSEEHVSETTNGEENAALKAEHEGKHAPPSHNGLGDKLKYKIFGKLYD